MCSLYIYIHPCVLLQWSLCSLAVFICLYHLNWNQQVHASPVLLRHEALGLCTKQKPKLHSCDLVTEQSRITIASCCVPLNGVQSMAVPPNHQMLDHFSIEPYGDLGIPHDLRNPQISDHPRAIFFAAGSFAAAFSAVPVVPLAKQEPHNSDLHGRDRWATPFQAMVGLDLDFSHDISVALFGNSKTIPSSMEHSFNQVDPSSNPFSPGCRLPSSSLHANKRSLCEIVHNYVVFRQTE